MGRSDDIWYYLLCCRLHYIDIGDDAMEELHHR